MWKIKKNKGQIAFNAERVLMGDGNIHVTECCQPTDIIGVVTEIIHKGRSVDCNSRCEQRKAKIWGKLLPIRRYLLYILKSATPFPKCYLQEKWTFDS